MKDTDSARTTRRAVDGNMTRGKWVTEAEVVNEETVEFIML